MRALELLNKLTLGNKLFVAILFVVSTTAQANELANSNRPLSDKQHQSNRCDTSTANWRAEQGKFRSACAKAGLGGSESSCRRKLEKCMSSSNKPKYCIGDATDIATHRENQREARDEKRELQERKDELMQSFRDKQNEILEAEQAQADAQQQVQQTLADNANQKVQLQQELEAKMQATVTAIADLKDQIATSELEISATSLEHETECRKTALAEKNRYIQLVRNRKMTVNQIYGRNNLSINQSGSIRYERVLSNCKSYYTSTGKITGFGRKIALLKKNIEIKQNRIRRQIDAQVVLRRALVKNTKHALAALDQKSQADLINFQNQNARAVERVQTLQSQANQMMSEYNQLSGEMKILGHKVTSSQVLAMAGLVTGKKSSSEKKERVAKQDKIDSFNEALGLMGMAENLEEDKEEICGNAKEESSVEAAQASIDLSGEDSADTTTATATPVEDPAALAADTAAAAAATVRRPAEEDAAEEARRPSAGETL